VDHEIEAEGSVMLVLGRLMGRVDAVFHNVNNVSGKVDGVSKEVAELGREVSALAVLSSTVTEIKADLLRTDSRLDALERTDRRQEGAAGVIQMILKSPAIGWLVGALSVAVALAKGWVHLS
jgi:hypothetical protein